MVRTSILALAFAACGHSSDAPGQTDPFWAFVTAHAPELQAEPVDAATADLQRELSASHPGVIAELGADGAHRRLVLTADGDRAMFPAIEAMYRTRPQVAGWDIVAFHPRETSRPQAEVAIGERTLDPQSVHYIAENRDGKLDLVVFVPGYTPHDKQLAQLAYIALDHAVGEYDVEMRIGAISLAAGDKAPAAAPPLGYLPRELDIALGSAAP
jgi:hypothetical protein